MSNQLATTSDNQVAQYHRQATDVAGACKQIVVKTAQTIGGRKYVRVEGWQSIATAHGCVASARDVERVEGGCRAIGEIRRIDTGAVIATAEGFVGDDEKTWASRAEYARRAMAQTRAISRACRSAFAHVVVLMDAGLETTPAEEVPADGFHDAPTRPAQSYREPKPATARIVDEQEAPAVEQKRPAKAPEAAPSVETADGVRVTFLRASRKDGQSAKGPWTRWGMHAEMPDGSKEWLNTFDANFGELIDGAAEGDAFLVQLKRGPRGVDLVDMGPAPGAASEPTKAQADADDDIPF